MLKVTAKSDKDPREKRRARRLGLSVEANEILIAGGAREKAEQRRAAGARTG